MYQKMNDEEAVEWLESIKVKYIHGGDSGMDEKRIEAIDYAIRSIKAWKQVPEIFRKRTKPITDGENDSKERHRYMQWLSDFNALYELVKRELGKIKEWR